MLRHIFNTVATALASMFIAMALGLPMPQIVMVTVVIVMQPLTRQVLDKSFHRLIGTMAGALAAWAIGELFSDSPTYFLAAVGVWVTLLTFAASYGKQLKAYSIVLTGYTPVLIGVPAVFQLGHVGAHAAERLGEVALGIACCAAAALLNGARSPAMSGAPPQTGAMTEQRTPRVAARRALLAALHPALAMLAMASLWLLTSWSGGAMATLNTTVNCALLALSAQPVRAALQMSAGTLGAVVAGSLLQLVYPAVATTVPLWLMLAPALALGAWATGKQETLLAGLGYSITLCMLAWPGANMPVHDAAGIALSIPVLTAICAILWPFRPQEAMA